MLVFDKIIKDFLSFSFIIYTIFFIKSIPFACTSGDCSGKNRDIGTAKNNPGEREER